MKAEHTPGPWKAHGTFIHDTREHELSQHPGKTMCIAGVTYNPPGWETTALADARLIAAAPDGYDFVVSALPILEQELESREHSGDEAYCAPIRALIEQAQAFLVKVQQH